MFNRSVFMQQKKALWYLVTLHLLIIATSNYLVRMPFSFFGLHTTWGAFIYPFTFVTTDLTVRIFGARLARKIIYSVMFPALGCSYVLSVLFFNGKYQGLSPLFEMNVFVARIALASFIAYSVGQLLDVGIFNRLRQSAQWWVAPACSTIMGNTLDSIVFFVVAFYHTTNPFMAEHWLQIAWIDSLFKCVISLCLFLPVYGFLLNHLLRRLTTFGHARVGDAVE